MLSNQIQDKFIQKNALFRIFRWIQIQIQNYSEKHLENILKYFHFDQ